jgi:hypothetical protein
MILSLRVLYLLKITATFKKSTQEMLKIHRNSSLSLRIEGKSLSRIKGMISKLSLVCEET